MADSTAYLNVESVLIVEDHHDAARVLAEVVTEIFKGPPRVTLAPTFTEGMASLVENGPFSIALVDLGLPDGSGVELVDRIADQGAETLIIVTTIFDDEEHLFDALRAGATGYLLKGHSPAELARYLVEAVSGRPALSPKIAQSMLGFFRDREARKTSAQNMVESLTGREREVLSLIARGCGVREVSELLGISPNTVSHHIKSLYSKLNVHNRAEATAAAMQLEIFKPT